MVFGKVLRTSKSLSVLLIEEFFARVISGNLEGIIPQAFFLKVLISTLATLVNNFD